MRFDKLTVITKSYFIPFKKAWIKLTNGKSQQKKNQKKKEKKKKKLTITNRQSKGKGNNIIYLPIVLTTALLAFSLSLLCIIYWHKNTTFFFWCILWRLRLFLVAESFETPFFCLNELKISEVAAVKLMSAEPVL